MSQKRKRICKGTLEFSTNPLTGIIAKRLNTIVTYISDTPNTIIKQEHIGIKVKS